MGFEVGSLVTRRRAGIGLVVLVVVLVAWFCWQAFTASRALQDARDSAGRVQSLIQAGDFAGASRELDHLRRDTDVAHSRTRGVLWDIGRHIPYLGRDVGAVQTVSAVLDTATRINAPIALELSKALDEGRFKPVNGQIDLAEVKRLTPSVDRAAASIAQAGKDLDAIRANTLTFPFNDLVGNLQTRVDAARGSATATASAFDLLPAMLGDAGARNYLLMIQNPAELRATGGLPGSLAILHADKGRITMGWQGSAANVNPFTSPVVKLPSDTLQQYGPTLATDFRDIGFTPDFPEAAQIARVMIREKQGTDVDGVVSIDPIALAGLLSGTGPIPVGNGVTLTAANAVPVLLSQTYQLIQNPGLQDTFFADVARKIFNAVTSGQGSQQASIRSLATSTSEHRVLLWSSHADEENRITETAIAGDLRSSSDKVPHVGMYLNNSSASKMDYYLQYRTSVAAVDCRQHGSQDLRVTVDLVSKMPTDFSKLGVYVLGTGAYSPQGTIADNLRIYAPYGGQVTGLQVDGVDHSVTANKHEGREVAFLPISLKPGQHTLVTADIQTADGQSGDGVFDFTPGMVPAPNGVKIVSACN
ncbi:MAG: hypothetical protein JWQ32_2644 [Marmoricola sp.]|nr:hypothetical protein [Marmoricola sp.]